MNTRDELVSFARASAHDLNNTVAALTMAVELAIEMLPEDDEELSSLLERVQRNAAKLASTIEAMPASAEAWELTEPADG